MNKYLTILISLFYTIQPIHIQTQITSWIHYSKCNTQCQSKAFSCGWLLKSCCTKSECSASLKQKCLTPKLIAIQCNPLENQQQKYLKFQIENILNKGKNKNESIGLWDFIGKIEQEIQKLGGLLNITDKIFNESAHEILKYISKEKNESLKKRLFQKLRQIVRNQINDLKVKKLEMGKNQQSEIKIRLIQKIKDLLFDLVDENHNKQQKMKNIQKKNQILQNITEKNKQINNTIKKIILNQSITKNQLKTMVKNLFKIQMEKQLLIQKVNLNDSLSVHSNNITNITNITANLQQINQKLHNITVPNTSNNTIINPHPNTQNHTNINQTINTTFLNHTTNQSINISINQTQNITKPQQIIRLINDTNTTKPKTQNQTKLINKISDILKPTVKVNNKDKTIITINKIITINTIITINKTDKINHVKQIDANDIISGKVSQNDMNDILNGVLANKKKKDEQNNNQIEEKQKNKDNMKREQKIGEEIKEDQKKGYGKQRITRTSQISINESVVGNGDIGKVS